MQGLLFILIDPSWAWKIVWLNTLRACQQSVIHHCSHYYELGSRRSVTAKTKTKPTQYPGLLKNVDMLPADYSLFNFVLRGPDFLELGEGWAAQQ